MPEQAGVNVDDSGMDSIHLDPGEHLAERRASSAMSVEDTSRSSSPNSTGLVDGSGQVCLCQKGPKIPRPRNGKCINPYGRERGI